MNKLDRFSLNGLTVVFVGMALLVLSQFVGDKAVAGMKAESIAQPVVLKPLPKYHGEHGYTEEERRELAEVVAKMDTREDYVTTLERTLW